jgi:hypothetical protein
MSTTVMGAGVFPSSMPRPDPFDPFDPSEPYYECRDCHQRVTASDYTGACPDCGGVLANINRPQE